MLLQKVLFHSFYGWVVFHCVCGVYTHTYHIFFIQSSVDGHFGCGHVLAMVNSAAMNTGEHVSLFKLEFSPGMCPGVELLNYMLTPIDSTLNESTCRKLVTIFNLPYILFVTHFTYFLNSCWLYWATWHKSEMSKSSGVFKILPFYYTISNYTFSGLVLLAEILLLELLWHRETGY